MRDFPVGKFFNHRRRRRFFFWKWSKLVIFFTKTIIMNVILNISRLWKLTQTIEKLSFQWFWSIYIKNQSVYTENVLKFSCSRFLIDHFLTTLDHLLIILDGFEPFSDGIFNKLRLDVIKPNLVSNLVPAQRAAGRRRPALRLRSLPEREPAAGGFFGTILTILDHHSGHEILMCWW